MKGTPLKWLRSYLSDRCFAVKVGNSQSADLRLKYGVPQGSVLGPFLFTVYSAATEAILKKHGIEYHKYADDIQIYLFYRPHVPGDLVCAIYRLQACFRELKQLLTTLKQKLKDCKTEFLALMSPHQLRKYGLPDLQLGTVLIKPAVSVRNLGAYFDRMLTMVSLINHKIKVTSYHLRRIGSIRKYITAGIWHKLVVALVTLMLTTVTLILTTVTNSYSWSGCKRCGPSSAAPEPCSKARNTLEGCNTYNTYPQRFTLAAHSRENQL